MQALSAARVLEVSERCAATGNTGKALALLAAGWPEAGERELAALPLGERDRRLLSLRAHTLGDRLAGRSRCPGCGEVLEFELATAELAGSGAAEPAELGTALGSLELELRQPNSFDLLAAERASSADEARRLLTEGCVREMRRDGRPIGGQELTDAELEALGERLVEAVSALEIRLGFECAACANRWQEQFDVAEFFAAELGALAERLLDEVHVLARGYGWSELEILAMSARRRAFYLERLGR